MKYIGSVGLVRGISCRSGQFFVYFWLFNEFIVS